MATLINFARISRPVSGVDIVASLWSRIIFWRRIAVERHALRALDGDRLADIGLDRDAAEKEAARRFWDAPAHWRQR